MSPIPADYVKDGGQRQSEVTLLEFLQKNKRQAYDIEELAKATKYSKPTINLAVKRLLAQKKIGRGRHGRRYYYFSK